MVQTEPARRTAGNNQHRDVHILSHKIRCGECGGWYGNKIWHSNDKYRRMVWRCNQKYKNKGKVYIAPFLEEKDIRERFTRALNKLLDGNAGCLGAGAETGRAAFRDGKP